MKTLLPALALFLASYANATDPVAIRVAEKHEKLFAAMRGVLTLEVTRCAAGVGSALLVPCLRLHACQNVEELQKVFGGNPFQLEGIDIHIVPLPTCMTPPRGGFIVHN